MAQLPLFLSVYIVYLTSLWWTAELHKTGGKNSDTSLQCTSLFRFASAGEHECQLNWAQDTLLALVLWFTVSNTSTVCHEMPFFTFFFQADGSPQTSIRRNQTLHLLLGRPCPGPQNGTRKGLLFHLPPWCNSKGATPSLFCQASSA